MLDLALALLIFRKFKNSSCVLMNSLTFSSLHSSTVSAHLEEYFSTVVDIGDKGA